MGRQTIAMHESMNETYSSNHTDAHASTGCALVTRRILSAFSSGGLDDKESVHDANWFGRLRLRDWWDELEACEYEATTSLYLCISCHRSRRWPTAHQIETRM